MFENEDREQYSTKLYKYLRQHKLKHLYLHELII